MYAHPKDSGYWKARALKAEAENQRLRELAASAQKCAEEKTAMIVELHKQRDEIERLREQVNEMSGTFTTKESVLKDAERYRWALANRSKMAAWCIYKTPPQITNLIDAAIDAASATNT